MALGLIETAAAEDLRIHTEISDALNRAYENLAEARLGVLDAMSKAESRDEQTGLAEVLISIGAAETQAEQRFRYFEQKLAKMLRGVA